ncbi:hypothetical protein [Escherichia coli]|uniref:hypothetical protein n=1 Tax=Escherichia coli TaxID=562 RepID=UPI002020EAFF|nr:hypothetical protein [Escherichia coli]
MVEIKRVPGFAQHGKGIAFLDSLRLRTKGEQSDKQQQYALQSSATDFLLLIISRNPACFHYE